MKRCLEIFVIVVFGLGMHFSSQAQTIHHVTVGGTDANPCTSGSPCATVQFVINNNVLVPGDTILVGAGTWTDEPINITAADDGDATDYVTILGVDSASTIFTYSFAATNQMHFNGAQYVRVKNIKFDDASDDMVQFSGASNNIIENCWIRDGIDEISIETSGGGCNSSDSNIIRYNYMESGSFTHVDINGSNACGTVHNTGNQIYGNTMVLLSGGAASPIVELSFADSTIIHSNRMIGGTRGIEIRSTGGANNVQVYNNYIKVTSDGFYNNGSAATSSMGKLYFNSFHVGHTAAFFRSLNGATQTNWEVVNNIFYVTSGSTSEYCLRTDGAGNFDKCDYNHYYIPNGARCARIAGSNRATLADLQSIDHSDEGALDGDENSIGGNLITDAPQYNNPTSFLPDALDLQATSPDFFAGITIGGIALDVYEKTRPGSPAIGAFDQDALLLPIELLQFEGFAQEGANLLHWSTASEQNASRYLVQRANSNKEYKTIGQLNAIGTSSQTTQYTFTDDTYEGTLHYYRLLSFDFDGALTSSTEIALERKVLIGEVLMYPNPAKSGQRIVISGLPTDGVEATVVRLYSCDGRLVKTLTYDGGGIVCPADVMAGTYFIEIAVGTERLIEVLTIQ